MQTIKSFTDLVAWQEGHKLVLMVYRTTSELPSKERYNIVNQLERAAISITNNIAEGFGRSSSKETTQFLFISLGSVKEVQNMLIASRDLNYINSEKYQGLMSQSSSVSRLLHGLIKANNSRAMN